MRTRVKICGITTLDDLNLACAAGADAVGFQLFDRSPRYIDLDTAELLVRSAWPLVTTVGLFVNHSSEHVSSVLEKIPFDLLQFHGDEPDDFCASFDRRFVKVIRVGSDTDIAGEAARFPSATGLLLDAKVEGLWGGSGQTFDWQTVPRLDKPVILAGGLDAANVSAAIKVVRPFAVDVCSGVESEPGRKDTRTLNDFVSAVDAVNEALDD